MKIYKKKGKYTGYLSGFIGIVLPLIVILVLILLVISLVIFKEPAVVNNILNYPDWWTYEDEKYGYQIKFPSDWTESMGNQYVAGVKQFELKKRPIEPGDPMVSIFFNPTTDELVKQYKDLKRAADGESVIFRNISVNKLKTVKLDKCSAVTYFVHQAEYGYSPQYETVCLDKNYSLAIRIASSNTEFLEKYKELYSKILKSFEFGKIVITDFTENEGQSPTPVKLVWKPYINSKYNFILEHPSTWNVHEDWTFDNYNFYIESGVVYFSPFQKSEIYDGNASFLVTVYKSEASNMDLVEFIEEFKNQAEEEFSKNIASDRQIKTDLNGIPAVQIERYYYDNQKRPHKYLKLYFIDNPEKQRKFVVGYSMLVIQEKEYKESLEKILASFNFYNQTRK